jgi:sorbitol-specific phosphotransferase system component IIA
MLRNIFTSMKNNGDSQQSRMVVTFDNNAPIELGDLTLSLYALSDEYRRFVQRDGDSVLDQDVKLYVSKVTEGSVIVELLTAYAPYVTTAATMLPIINNVNTIVQFG